MRFIGAAGTDKNRQVTEQQEVMRQVLRSHLFILDSFSNFVSVRT